MQRRKRPKFPPKVLKEFSSNPGGLLAVLPHLKSVPDSMLKEPHLFEFSNEFLSELLQLAPHAVTRFFEVVRPLNLPSPALKDICMFLEDFQASDDDLRAVGNILASGNLSTNGKAVLLGATSDDLALFAKRPVEVCVKALETVALLAPTSWKYGVAMCLQEQEDEEDEEDEGVVLGGAASSPKSPVYIPASPVESNTALPNVTPAPEPRTAERPDEQDASMPDPTPPRQPPPVGTPDHASSPRPPPVEPVPNVQVGTPDHPSSPHPSTAGRFALPSELPTVQPEERRSGTVGPGPFSSPFAKSVRVDADDELEDFQRVAPTPGLSGADLEAFWKAPSPRPSDKSMTELFRSPSKKTLGEDEAEDEGGSMNLVDDDEDIQKEVVETHLPADHTEVPAGYTEETFRTFHGLAPQAIVLDNPVPRLPLEDYGFMPVGFAAEMGYWGPKDAGWSKHRDHDSRALDSKSTPMINSLMYHIRRKGKFTSLWP